ncbi:exosome complex component RRP4 [Pteropus vampyrus]|uniref:Exosome complex component RRP4 n=1 Tax=Pteropus vampyrus TaxID=132908 RepID=A0A6P6CXT4_PTEVA|nr:exosome complex component RRP4 [Pteropus vampyrus]
MAMEMRLPVARKPLSDSLGRESKKHLVVPGDTITTDTGFMRYVGTWGLGGHRDGCRALHVACQPKPGPLSPCVKAPASPRAHLQSIPAVWFQRPRASTPCISYVPVCVCFGPLKRSSLGLWWPYNGEVGDIVVGRITEVQQKRWKVETNSRLDSVLLLSSMNLPGGELRRRSAEDELAMRGFLQEGDLISAEVQAVFSDGAVSLHTRSLKYGKLGQGVLVQVSPSLVKRQKTHFHDLPCGASVILGNNGFIWIYPTPEQKEEDAGGFTANLEPVSLADREVISRLRNCIVSLVTQRMMLYDTSILYCYEASLPHQIKDILKPEIMEEIVMETRQRLLEQEG